jgi:hypothetical protein
MKTLKGLIIVLSFCFSLVFIGFAVGGPWTTKADMPTPGLFLSASTVNGKIYVIGGYSTLWNLARGIIVEEYDTATNTWKKKADMPTARSGLCACEVNGKIYAIGGNDLVGSLATVEEYDPVKDTWTKKTDMPTPRCRLTAVAVDGKIYVIGGWGHWCIPTVEEYDPAKDTWTKKKDMPTARQDLAVAAVDGKIYAFGGDTSWDNDNFILSAVEEYDPITDKWTNKSDMPERRAGLCAVTVGDRIYIVGGGDRVWGPYSTIMREYNPATDTYIRKSDIPTARTTPAAGVVNGKIYVIGGATSPFVSVPTVEEYDTGILDQSVEAKDKLATSWGKIKSN